MKNFIVIIKGDQITLLINKEKYQFKRTKKNIERLDKIVKTYFASLNTA